MTEEEEIAYLHPFGCEARAFVRLKELHLDDLAVPCHGYIMLDQVHQACLREADHHDWEHDWGYDASYDKDEPLKALVKEFVGNDIGLPDGNQEMIEAVISSRGKGQKLIQNLKKIHRSGILVRETNAGNILNGLFLDFSMAWTVPHPVLDPEKMDDGHTLDRDDQGYSDAAQLDMIIDIWNEEHDTSERTWDRALPDLVYIKRLRSHQDPKRYEKRPFNRKNHGWRIRPERYKWEEAPIAAKPIPKPLGNTQKGNGKVEGNRDDETRNSEDDETKSNAAGKNEGGSEVANAKPALGVKRREKKSAKFGTKILNKQRRRTKQPRKR